MAHVSGLLCRSAAAHVFTGSSAHVSDLWCTCFDCSAGQRLLTFEAEISRERVPIRNAYKAAGQTAAIRINGGAKHVLPVRVRCGEGFKGFKGVILGHQAACVDDSRGAARALSARGACLSLL